MTDHPRRPFAGLPEYTPDEAAGRARAFRDKVAARRTIRDYADRPVPREVIAACIEAAGQAPSGANMQPWHFVAVGDPAIKRQIRLAAEEEERKFYGGRAGDEWLEALEPFGTDHRKPFLETAPWLIVIFEQRYGLDDHGDKVKFYYTKESVGLASGFLIAALHDAGLSTLTHTPSPMNFLNRILDRPPSEKPFLLLVVGYPAEGATVPDITRKGPAEYIQFVEGDTTA